MPNQKTSVAVVLGEFGNLIQQFPLGQRWLNLELAIAAYLQAMKLISRTATPIEWAITQTNLATAYCSRIRGNRADNIEQAITIYKQAMTVRTESADPIEWASIMNNLAVAYKNRIQGKRADNIELAIAACQQALTVRTRTEAPAEWAGTMNNLAGAYNERILGDRIDNIEQTINACQQALTVRTRTDMPREWAQTTNNLASAYKGRLRGKRADNIELAIAAYRQVLTVTTQSDMPIEWAGTMMNLATAYRDNIEGDRAGNIEKAILAYQKVLTVRTQTALPIEWAEAINHLAAAFYRRIRGNHANNIEKAISAYRQALIVRTQAALPIEWAGTMMNLAVAYQNRVEGNYTNNIELAITCYQNSLKVVQPTLLPHDCRRCARALANLYSNQQRWHESVPIYKIALQAAENLYQSTNFLDSKSTELMETGDLICRASYAVARTGDFESAVAILERGRARAFNESLARNHADLIQLQEQHPNLYSQYQNVVYQIRNTDNQQRELKISQERYSTTSSVLRENVENLRQQLDAAIQSIRQIPEYRDFLALPSFNEVQQAVQQDRPLVYILTTPEGSLALVVTSKNIEHFWLDDFTETHLFEHIKTWFASYLNPVEVNRQDWEKAITAITRQLWEPLMAQLIHRLQAIGYTQAVLVPTGFLSLMPLNAAWTEDPNVSTGRRYALDDINFTYAPSARSLVVARAIADCIQVDSILAIDNPQQDLKNSDRETKAAVNSFKNSIILHHTEATIATVKEQLSTNVIAHFSCHGTANLSEPLNSGLAMSDGLLTLKDIFALNLVESGGLRLAILSACETGLQGIENSDEAISLPTGLLQAGVAAVISSLWSVSDLSTMILLTRFYDFWRTEGSEISQALRQAQQWVRDTTNAAKIRLSQSHLSKTC